MSSWREEYLDRLKPRGGGIDTVFSELAQLTKDLGFEFCSFGVSAPVLGDQPSELWSTTYPLPWQNRYLGNNYRAIDPVIRAATRGTTPIVWSGELFQDQCPFWEDARAHGACHGWTLGMQGRHGETGLISLARSEQALSPAELDDSEAKLVWLSHVANGVIGGLFTQSASRVDREITEREREVLRWTSMGKTSSEIGIILGISTRTVNFHVASLLLKLDAVNKTHAVAKAALMNIL